MSNVTSIAGIPGQCRLVISTPRTLAHTPQTAPSDRSISPSSNTSTTPIPSVPTPPVCNTRYRGRAGVAAWRDRSIARSGLWSVCERSRRADHQPALARDSRDASDVAHWDADRSAPGRGDGLYRSALLHCDARWISCLAGGPTHLTWRCWGIDRPRSHCTEFRIVLSHGVYEYCLRDFHRRDRPGEPAGAQEITPPRWAGALLHLHAHSSRGWGHRWDRRGYYPLRCLFWHPVYGRSSACRRCTAHLDDEPLSFREVCLCDWWQR